MIDHRDFWAQLTIWILLNHARDLHHYLDELEDRGLIEPEDWMDGEWREG